MERRKQAGKEVQPPDMESLNAAREVRMKEIAMEALLKEIVIYAIFVLIVFFLSYQARDSDSFIFAENVKNTFFRNSPTFDSVSISLGDKNYLLLFNFLSNISSVFKGARGTCATSPPLNIKVFKLNKLMS